MPKSKKVRGIYEREPGSGVWSFRYADENRKLQRKLGGTKEQAKNAYRQAKKTVRAAKLAPPPTDVLVNAPPPQTLAGMIDDVLARTKGVLRSWREYQRSGKMWKAEYPGRALDDITPGDIERWRAAKLAQKEPPKTATLNRHLAFLRRVYRLAINDGLCTRTPFLGIKLARENNARVRFLSEDEEKRLCKALDDERDRIMVRVAVSTGMRQAEHFNAEWEWVDFENSVIVIPRSKHGERRTVPLSPAVVGYFERMRELSGNSRYVFPCSTGTTPLHASNYSKRIFRPALVTAGIENFHWHDLRHTFGSRLAMAGATPFEIQQLMGHKSLKMVERYVHLTQGHLHTTVSKLDVVADRIHGTNGGAHAPTESIEEVYDPFA